MDEGLLLPLEDSYRFLHDRVQEAAYSLIPQEERSPLHLHIGRLMFAGLSEQEREQRVFELAHQFNLGAALITEPEERMRAVRLNLVAGRKAKGQAAYRSAAGYLVTAVNLLGDAWEERHDLAFACCRDLAEAHFLCGNFADAQRLFPVLLSQARTRIEKVEAYRVKIDTHNIKGEGGRAIESALECLGLFGITMAPHPTGDEVRQAYAAVWEELGARPVEALVELPLMADPEMRGAMEILSRLYIPAYYSDNNLFYLHICLGVKLSLTYGNAPASTYAYGWFGVLLATTFHRPGDGYRFARLAYDLMERNNFLAYKAQVNIHLKFVAYWSRSMDEEVAYCRAMFEAGVATGDVAAACFSWSEMMLGMITRGDPLQEVLEVAQHGLEYVERAGFCDVLELLRGIERFVQSMRGCTRHLASYDDDHFNEAEFERRMDPLRMPSLVFYYHCVKLMARFIANDLDAALASGAKAKELLWAGLFSAQSHYFYLYYALAVAGAFDRLTAEQQADARELLALHEKQLREWADDYPPTFLTGHALVCAEIARISGKEPESELLYEQAIRSARESGFVHNEGIAFELAARFYRSRDLGRIADLYLREARACYLRWGAHGKVRQLDRQHPWLKEEARPRQAGSAELAGQVDAITVVKASQAISGEIVLRSLLDKLMRIVLENAGAQKGFLLLPAAETLTIESCGVLEGEEIRVFEPAPSQLPELVPRAIVDLVRRSHETVMLEDAREHNPFSLDPYLLRNKPVSVLCLPVLRLGDLVAILYLENNMVRGAFSADRLGVLGVLAAQAAMSLENARIYEDLRQAEARYRSIFENALEGIFQATPGGRYVDANPALARILGYASPRELMEQVTDIREQLYVEPRQRDQLRRLLEESGIVEGFETLFRCKDGSVIRVVIGARCVRDQEGQLLYFEGSVLDITERKQAEEAIRESEQRYRLLSENLEERVSQAVDELRQKDKMLIVQSRQALMGEMINNIAHQWRQPLNMLGLLAQELPMVYRSGAFNQQYLENNREKTMEVIQHMSRTIDDFRNFFKSEKEMVLFKAREVLERTLSIMEASLAGQKIEVRVDARGEPFINGYPNEFSQVILNIINNARDAFATRKTSHPLIAIGLYSQGAKTIVTVTDNAGGIPEEIMDRIFEPYFTTKGPEQGTGLGLFMCQTIIKNMNGSISVRNVEAGAEFRIELSTAPAREGV